MKQKHERQIAKIREIGEALRNAGYVNIRMQQAALGIRRSTVFTLIQARHKGTGLTPNVINQILAHPHTPPEVRKVVIEYVKEKASGAYGHCPQGQKRFTLAIQFDQA